MTAMIKIFSPTYYAIADGDTRIEGESEQLTWTWNHPEAGDRLSLGLARLWEVTAVHQYRPKDGTALYVAYMALVSIEPMPRAEWFDVRRLLESPATCLNLYANRDGALHQSSRNFLGEAPATGHFLSQFDAETRKTSASTFWTTGYTTFTSSDPSATFDKIHLARVEEYLETDENASVLNPEKILATAVHP
jgi:hypothetical protein